MHFAKEDFRILGLSYRVILGQSSTIYSFPNTLKNLEKMLLLSEITSKCRHLNQIF